MKAAHGRLTALALSAVDDLVVRCEAGAIF
jgi:hypothetical protein